MSECVGSSYTSAGVGVGPSSVGSVGVAGIVRANVTRDAGLSVGGICTVGYNGWTTDGGWYPRIALGE